MPGQYNGSIQTLKSGKGLSNLVLKACDSGPNPDLGASDFMSVVLKIDKGTAEKLIQWLELKPDQSRNLTGKELTLELENSEVFVEPHKEGYKRMIEISDMNGSFGLWVELTNEKVEKLKSILKEYQTMGS